jgi:hypothetical protein
MATKTLVTVEDFVRLPESMDTRDGRYDGVTRRRAEEQLEGPDLLPGFSIPLDSLFEPQDRISRAVYSGG